MIKLIFFSKADNLPTSTVTSVKKQRSDSFCAADVAYIRDNWQTKTIREIAQVLGRTYGSIKSKGQKAMGLRKTPETIQAISRRPNAGQFQKGQLPANTVYGDEKIIRTRFNKKRNIYTKYIRTGFKQWQEYQHYVWEQAYGPVAKGMILTFENGDRLDVRLDNLKLITMAENAIRNSGSLNLSDGNVVNMLAWRDPELKQEFRKHPELIELKRNQIQLNRTIKRHDNQ